MLWNYLKTNMLKNPYQLCCEGSAQMTFEELVIWAEMFSKRLTVLRCCAILCNSEMATSMALLACMAAGICAVPLSSRYGESHCRKIIDAISPDAVISDKSGDFCVYYNPDACFVVPKNNPTVIMSTSGTTGSPKSIMLSDKNIMTNCRDILEYMKLNKTDSILISRPLYHSAVLTGEFLTALISGVRIHFISDNFSPVALLKTIEELGITVFCGTPTMLKIMSEMSNRWDHSSLRKIVVSGECMDKTTGDLIKSAFSSADIFHVYGLTEASPRVCYLPPDLFDKYSDCVGIPLRSVEIKILNDSNQEAVSGEEGLLYVKGDNVMLGYYQDDKKTTNTIRNGWLSTGDIAVINEAGLLKIKGRADDMIIKAGMNIYPSEIESALKADSRIKDALVYSYKNRFGTQIGLKIVGDINDVDEVKQICIDRLPLFQVPTIIEIVPSIPKNASGKKERHKCDA